MMTQENSTGQEARNILIPTDFSDVSETAINHACYLAKIFNKPITLLHVVEANLFTSEKKMLDQEAKDLAHLNEVANRVKAVENLEISCMTRRGNIFDTIGEVAEDINASLVVMGTHGVKGIQHIIGSRALRVIANSDRPFVVVQEKRIRPHGYKNIVLPIDFSRESKQKLAWAVKLGEKFDSTFNILADHESDEFAARALNNNILFAENFLKERGCRFTVKKIKKGESFARETVRYAAALDADLIMIMTDPDLHLADYIAGPDEQKIIGNEAQIPVMAINEVSTSQLNTPAMFQ